MKINKKITAGILAVVILFFAACKKDNPSIVGKWTFTNYQAKSMGLFSNNDTVTSNQTYNAQTQKLVDITYRSTGMPYYDTGYTSLSYSYWNIESNGSYTIDENSGTTTGTWEYLNNSSGNNAILMQSGGSVLVPAVSANGILLVQPLSIITLTDHQLVLGYSSSFASDTSGGYFSNGYDQITFSR